MEDTLGGTEGGLPDAHSAPRRARRLVRGDSVGRYVVLSRIGRGATGLVWLAYDPELDRRVAIKLLAGSASGDEAARTRLLREARALAKLRHPNVVTIHDVGVHDERIFLAMEYVEGQTLGSWVAERQPRWRETLRAYLAAGEGLAAAHGEGVVHRDFKPDNVMIDTDGRVVVLDFGLARAVEDESKRLTMPGQVMGTPAYMAPEQHGLGDAGPAADQFGFCASLWEALYGERPYPGESLAAILFAIEEGRLRRPPPSTRVPAHIRSALARGLARLPDDRHPDVASALLALRRDPPRRIRTVSISVAAVAVVATAFWSSSALDARARSNCTRDASALRDRWAGEVRAQVREAMEGTGLPFAGSSFAQTVPWLERQIDDVERAHAQTCLAAHDGALSEPAAAARMQCLDERRAELSELWRVLADPSGTTVAQSVTIAAELSPVASCRERPPLLSEDAETKVQRQRLLEELAAIPVQSTVDRSRAKSRAQHALAAAEHLGAKDLIARAHLVLGQALRDAGETEAARVELESAMLQALRLGHDEVSVGAALDAMSLVGLGSGTDQADHGTALVWGEVAESGLDRMGAREDDLRRARLLHTRGSVTSALGRHDEALAMHRRGLEIRQEALGPAHPLVAASLDRLGVTLHHGGEFELACTELTHAREVSEGALGPSQLQLASILEHLAEAQARCGLELESSRTRDRALGITIALRGPEDSGVVEELRRRSAPPPSG